MLAKSASQYRIVESLLLLASYLKKPSAVLNDQP